VQIVTAPPAPAHEVIAAPIVLAGSVCLLESFGSSAVTGWLAWFYVGSRVALGKPAVMRENARRDADPKGS